jgi:hypothetical protein
MAIKKKKTLKPIRPRKKDEKEYSKAIDNELLRPLLSRVLERLENIPRIKTAWTNSVLEEIEILITEETLGEKLASDAMNALRLYHKNKTAESFKTALNIDINLFGSELGVKELMQQSIKTNSELIKSIPVEMLERFRNKFQAEFEKHPFDQERFFNILNTEFKVGKNRAKFIARDQTSKVIGNLTEKRQTDLGLDTYIWRNMQDIAVVGNPAGLYPRGNPGHMDHWSREGKEFRWDSPPPDGHPGQAFN